MLLVHRTMLTSFSICCWFSEPCFSNEPQGWQRGFPMTVMFFRAFRVLKIWGGPTFKVLTCANYHSRQIWDTWVWLQGRGQSANSPDFTTWAPPISSLRGQQPSIFECWKTLQFGLVCLLFLPKAESETGMSALVALKFSWYFNGHHRPTKKPHRKTMTHPALGGSIDLPFLDSTPIGWIPPSSPAAGAKKMQKSQLQLRSWQVSIWILVILTKNHGNMVKYVPNNPYYSWLHPQTWNLCSWKCRCYSQTMRKLWNRSHFRILHAHLFLQKSHFCWCRSPCLAGHIPQMSIKFVNFLLPFGYD